MPTVPRYDNFQATPNTLPQARLNAPVVQDVAGQQAQQLGAAMTNFGQHMGNIALDKQKEANQLRVDDALNRAKEATLKLTYDKDAGFTNIKGINALERPDGKPLTDEYGATLKSELDTISSTLGNDAQRQAFTAYAGGMLTSFRGQLVQHEAQEFKNYSLSVAEGVQATALREIGLRWQEPEAVDAAVQRIRAEGYRQGQLLGKSAEWQEASVRKLTSNAHKTALLAALEQNNPLYADSHLKKYAGQMDADDILAVRSHITKAVDMQVGTTAGVQVFERFAPRLAPGDGARLENIVMGIESGGRRYGADGKMLEGPATKHGTAKGEMQVLDGTNKDPGFGVKPAKDDSPEERARVGRDYLNVMAARYQGEVPKILAAYNWGPGNLDKAIKEHGTNWLEHAPKETRDYVARGAAEYGAGGGAPARPTLAEMKAELRRQPDMASNPTRLKFAEDRLEVEYKAMADGIKAQEEQALDQAYRGLYANGGNFEALPAGVRTAIPGQKLNGVLDFAREIAKNGGTVHRPEAWAQILSLPRDELAKMTPAQFYEKFRPVLDDTHLEKGYALLADSQGSATDKHLEIITTSNRMKQAAVGAGLLPATGKANERQEKDFAQFTGIVDQRVRQFERTDLGGKRKANSEELQRVIDGVMMDKAFVSEWGSDPKRPVSMLTPEQQASAYVRVNGQDVAISSVPQTQRATILSKLQARGLPVTEQAIAELWVRAGRPK